MDELTQLLPLLIPFVVVQLGLLIAALVHIFRHETYRVGNRMIWVLVCLFVNIIGPIVYFVVGRGED